MKENPGIRREKSDTSECVKIPTHIESVQGIR